MEYTEGCIDEKEQKARASFELIRRVQIGLADGATAEQRLAGGRAFDEIYMLYSEQVRRFVCQRVRSLDVAEDITADTFVRAFRGLARYEWQGRDVGAWFTTIARNLVADHFKSARVRLAADADDEFLAAMPDTHPSSSPEKMAIAAIEAESLHEAIKHLTPAQRQVVELHFLQDFKVRETADALGRSESQVKSLGYRAIRTLAKLLENGGMPVAVPQPAAGPAPLQLTQDAMPPLAHDVVARQAQDAVPQPASNPHAEAIAMRAAEETPWYAEILPGDVKQGVMHLRLITFLRLPHEEGEIGQSIATVRELIESLDVPEQSKRAAMLQFGITPNGVTLTQQEIADYFGCTKKQVTLMVTTVKQKLKVKTWHR